MFNDIGAMIVVTPPLAIAHILQHIQPPYHAQLPFDFEQRIMETEHAHVESDMNGELCYEKIIVLLNLV